MNFQADGLLSGKCAVFFGLVLPAILPVLYFNDLLNTSGQTTFYVRDQWTKPTVRPNLSRAIITISTNLNHHDHGSSPSTNGLASQSPNGTATFKFENSSKSRINDSLNHADRSRGMLKNNVLESNRTLNSSVSHGKDINGPGETEGKDIINKDLRGYVSILNKSESVQLNCSKCAYVSSSGRLLGSRAGQLIDSFDCVIRMNDARIDGFEDDVGKRTTVRIVAHSAIAGVRRMSKTLLPGTNAVILWGPAKTMETHRISSSYNVAKSIANDLAKFDVKVYYLSKDQYEFADDVFELETGKNRFQSRTWLTTGWFTMLFARAACGEVHVFGMVNEDHCRKELNSTVPYHYYSPNGPTECSTYRRSEGPKAKGHHFMTEKSIFARWAQRDKSIFFKYPDWSV